MKAGIIGATGYAGAELARLLACHPRVEELILSSHSFEGKNITDVYPNFLGRVSLPLVTPEEVIAAADVVFSALPHGVGEQFAQACVAKGIPFIDLSADFRFDDDEATFSAWYGKPYQFPELHKNSVYGLPELNKSRIRELAKSRRVIIGNPGCYPTSASLGCYPALSEGLAAEGGVIIVDAASGISGGGREPSRSFHYPECADSVSPYKVGAHRHTPEIARNVAVMARKDPLSAAAPSVIFTPHLAPMNRGILGTIYIPLREKFKAVNSDKTGIRPPTQAIEQKIIEIQNLYSQFYRDKPFVRVLPPGVIAATNRVRQSNYCDISIHLDHSGSTLIVVSAIDNMIKGAAGQAIQNMNIIFNFEEEDGLKMIPALF